MSFLVDTNIVSELGRGSRCDPGVASWLGGVGEEDLWLSVLVLGELRKGVDMARRKDPGKADVLEASLMAVSAGFAGRGRVLPVDRTVALEWGRMAAVRTVSVIDSMLAATAKVNGLTLVTRNEKDVAGLGADVLNPFNS